MAVVIDFFADGQAQAMHRDSFDLGFLGTKKVERASDIRFDDSSQLWDIHVTPTNRCSVLVASARGFDAYDAARRVEVTWFDACRIQSAIPLSEKGQSILQKIRAGL